ncbi:NAD+ synthetase [Candidatus Magnetoovum chiemensis]|nr:NAD+ synthetase [Candidatus Magnetoovum chiemensis]
MEGLKTCFSKKVSKSFSSLLCGIIIMRLIKIGLANINTTVGDFTGNTEKIINCMREMAAQKCTVGAFCEQAISGYPAEDLVLWGYFVERQRQCLFEIGKASKDLPFRTVFTVGFTMAHNSNIYNCAAVVSCGSIIGIVPKEKLPTYNVFYEGRTFSSGIEGSVIYVDGIAFGDIIFKFPFGVVACEVCEDIWSADGPMRRRAYSGAELIINASSSPWRCGINDTRREIISTRAFDNQATVVYVNQYGGNDSLVFDGGGFINQNGRMLIEAPRWKEGITTKIADLDRTAHLRREGTTWRKDFEEFHKNHKTVFIVESSFGALPNDRDYKYPFPENKSFFLPSDKPMINQKEQFFEDIVEAMITGLDYFVKTKVFTKIGIALSGGKDSLLTLIIAWLFAKRRFSALLPEEEKSLAIYNFITCFSMPSSYNSDETKNISTTICKELGVCLKDIGIQEAFEREKAYTEQMLEPNEKLTPLTIQNIQARIRGQRMQNWANSSNAMWLQTSNMSEKAVGYTTIGGDMMGAYSLIANLPKTIIIYLLEYLSGKLKLKALEMSLKTKASAELAPNQEDEKDLMPFAVLDACMYLFVEEKLRPREIYEILRSMWSDDELKQMRADYKPQMLKQWVKRFVILFKGSIFKWVQTPQSVHLGKLELDRERALQLPVVQSSDWIDLENF